jgi:hypothetical protein
MCVIVQKKCVMLLTAYRAAVLHVNMLKDSIEMDGKEISLMIKRTKNNIINAYSQYRHGQLRYLVETVNILPS